MAEVESVLILILAQGSGSAQLFLLDALYRGTNTVERVAAASAVPRRLDRADDLVVVTAHYLELIQLLAGRYAAFNLREEVGEGGSVLDYRIRAGVGSTRNANALLERMGYSRRWWGRRGRSRGSDTLGRDVVGDVLFDAYVFRRLVSSLTANASSPSAALLGPRLTLAAHA